jgi:hypothetical protein
MSPVWHDAVDRPRTYYTLQNANSGTANITVTVDSKRLHYLISRRKLQQSAEDWCPVTLKAL